MRGLAFFVALFFFVPAGLLGCSETRVVDVPPGELSVAPDVLDFGAVALGTPLAGVFVVSNVGRGPLELEISSGSAEVFVSPSGAVRVESGGAVELSVQWLPVATGSVSASVEVVLAESRRSVSLLATVTASPACSRVDACGSESSEGGVCVWRPFADGTVCGDACLTGGFCKRGVCVGQPVVCDDGNACTVDFCEPLLGCRTAPLACPASGPCRASVCDPASGCGAVDVRDGASCGKSDCSSSLVCLAGSCTSVATPAGKECWATPCSMGTCSSGGVCSNPGSVVLPLRPEWVTAVPVFSRAQAARREGAVFFLSRPSSGLVAEQRFGRVNSDGSKVFERGAALAAGEDGALFSSVVATDVSVVLYRNGGGAHDLRAFDPVTGDFLWEMDLQALHATSWQPVLVATMLAGIAAGPDFVAVVVRAPHPTPVFGTCGGVNRGGAMFAIVHARTGVVEFDLPFTDCHRDTPPVVDNQGQIFLAWGEENLITLRAIRRDGTQVWWRTSSSHASAVGHGLLGLSDGRIHDGSDGTQVARVDGGVVALGARAGWARGVDGTVFSFAPDSGVALGARVPAGGEAPIGMAEDGTLIRLGGSDVVVGHAPDGGSWSCVIDVADSGVSGALAPGFLFGEMAVMSGGGDGGSVFFGVPLRGVRTAVGDWAENAGGLGNFGPR